MIKEIPANRPNDHRGQGQGAHNKPKQRLQNNIGSITKTVTPSPAEKTKVAITTLTVIYCNAITSSLSAFKRTLNLPRGYCTMTSVSNSHQEMCATYGMK